MLVVELELLDDPPGRSPVGDMAAKPLGHAGVEDGKHEAAAGED